MSIDINEKTPSTEDPPPQPERIWLNHLAEIEGYLSLMIVLWLFIRKKYWMGGIDWSRITRNVDITENDLLGLYCLTPFSYK